MSVAETCGVNRMIRSTYIVASAANAISRACSRNAALDLSMDGTWTPAWERGGAVVV